MKKALIFQGRIIEVAAVEFPVSPEMVWENVADSVFPETHIWNGTAVVPKPPKTQTELDKEASDLAKANLAQLRADTYPDVLAFLATLPGVPNAIKTAATTAAAEKSKVK